MLRNIGFGKADTAAYVTEAGDGGDTAAAREALVQNFLAEKEVFPE